MAWITLHSGPFSCVIFPLLSERHTVELHLEFYSRLHYNYMAMRELDDPRWQMETFSMCNTVWYFSKSDAGVSVFVPSAVGMNTARVATWDASLLLSVAWHKALVVFRWAFECTTPSSLVRWSCNLGSIHHVWLLAQYEFMDVRVQLKTLIRVFWVRHKAQKTCAKFFSFFMLSSRWFIECLYPHRDGSIWREI